MKLGTCLECGAPASVSYGFEMTAHILVGGEEVCHPVWFERWACTGKPQHFIDVEAT